MRRLLIIAMLTGFTGALLSTVIRYNLFPDHRELPGILTTVVLIPLTVLPGISIMVAKGVSERSKRLIYLGIIFGCLAWTAGYFLSFIMPSIESVMHIMSTPPPDSIMNGMPMHGSSMEEMPTDIYPPTYLLMLYPIITHIISSAPVGFFAALIKREADFKGSSLKFVAVAGIIAALLGFAGQYLSANIIGVVFFLPLYVLTEGQALQLYMSSIYSLTSIISILISAALGSAGIWLGVEWTYSRLLGKPDGAP